MNELRIAATKTSPEILLNPGGMIRIRGRSVHENALEFFKPVDDWVNDYINEPADVTSIDIHLDYINSANAKILTQLIQKISRVRLLNKKLIINWYYEEGDEDIHERGEYFSSALNIPFNFVKAD